MDQFNLSRYASLTVQRVEPSEEKPLPRAIENEEEIHNEDCSDEEDDFSGSDEEANKTLEIPKTEGESEETEIPTTTDTNVEVKLEPENSQNKLGNEITNDEQNDQEIEANSKRKSGEEDDDQTLKKAKMNEERTSDEDPDNQTTSEKRATNMRRNIREVMDETKLDESTLAAQRQEMERLRRVQEQQRMIRDVQKQIAINRQNSKAQDRVMSLLQGGTTSLIKKSSVPTEPQEQTKSNTIVISTDSGSPQIFNRKMLEILKNQPDVSTECNEIDKLSSIASKLGDVSEPHMVTSSVSIAPIKPTKIAEVVTISSGSEEEVEQKPPSSDDDCILISGDEEEEDIADDDAHNSGMHTNDSYNLPDESGRVLINVGHPDNEPDVFLAPQIARIIKPHQIGGVRFLYDNVVESLERFKSSKGFGCILAHSMGLGKTLQVVSFCDVFLRHTPAKHVLCIMPINTLQNWMAEFNMWLPLPDDTKNFSEDTTKNNNTIYRQFPLFVLNDFHKTISARGKVIHSWRNEGGVLLMGYELYRQLTSRKPRKKRNKKQIDDDFYDEKNKPLLDEMREALVRPGPDLVICDEGHRIKNSHASTSQSLKEIESRRRVVLTGYPLQNNLLEYWCMVDFVRPNYLGTKTEFSNMFERPIQNGQCIDSTPQDIRLMRHRAHVLHSLLEGFVQRRSHSVLEETLPLKEEYVLLVRLTPLQRLLYDRFMNEVVRKKAVPNPLKAFAVCCKIWNHPDILYYFLKKRSLDEAEIDLDLEEASTPLGTPLGPTPATSPSAAPKRSRNRWPKGGGMNPNSKELKINPNRKFQNIKKDQIKTPAVATVMPNTSNNQLITPTSHNHNTTAATQPIQSNQFDDYSSQSQQYGNQGNFANQPFNNYNQNYNSSYWKESGNFYRGNSEYYQSNQGSETKSQYPYPQDPRLEVGEIRVVKSEPSYQSYEETSYSGSNDQNQYQNRGFNQDTTQVTQEPEQPLHSQSFTSDIHKVNPGNFSNQSTNKETLACQSISNIPRLQTENITDQMSMSKPKPKNVRNRKSTMNNKQIQKNQSITMANSGLSTLVANNCNDNDSNLANQQVLSNTKEISFRQAFNQVNNQEVHSNSNQGLFANNQDILTSNNKGIFGSSSANNEDLQFTSSHTSLSESNKGIYESGLLKQGNDNSTGMAVSFEGIFDNNRIMTNHQKSNLNHQHSTQTNISQQDISNSISNNQGTLNNQSIQNQVTNQLIDNPRIMNNNSANQGVRNQGMLLCDTNNQGHLTNSQGTLQHNHSRPIQHDHSMLTGHQEIDQKFVNQQQHQLQQQQQQKQQLQHQQQQQQHQQQKQQQQNQQQQQQHQQQQQQQQHHQQQLHRNQEQHYQNADNVLSNRGQVPIREPFINPNNSSNNYNNYMLESNQHMASQNHNYGNMLPSSPFQNQNIFNDQMLHDQEMLLANDQAMLSVLNSTTDANEQALLYNAMVGQPDGQGLLGLLEPPSMLNNQINEYQPVYGPLPSNVKPGLPGGAKTDPESNQYPRAPIMPHMIGRGVGLMPGTHNPTEVKMFPDPNRFNISNSNDSYSRYSNYSSMYPPYTPSTSTPLGSISDILDNIPGPECTYQPPERKNPAPCTITSQDVNPLPPFRSLENKTKYEFGSTNADIDKSHEEKSTLFSLTKESRSLDDTIDPKLSTLEEGEIKNPSLLMKSGKEEPGIPYDWAVELFNDYVPGMIEASAKMSLLFAIVEESVRIGDRVLLFSQSLFTLDLIEEFLQRNKIPGKDENWCRNCDYYRLDGSTSASEREKLINDFNICSTVHLFLVSTRAGSLGINLVGANRVIVFDASWNPCHDTQAVCRVYRYGQKKPCFVYRLVTDNCLEKKIYDRQINKQVMADRVVDECNPDAHLSIKEVTNLCWDDGESLPTKDFSSLKDNYEDTVIKYIVENLSSVLTKEPFQHESLFVDRKDKKLSQAEKRLAKRSYEMEKKANSRPMYSYYGQTPTSSLYRNQMGKPMASVRPMQSMSNTSSVMASRNALNRRWIPAEVWQKQGMSAQEMTLPLDVVIPTNAGDRGSIVLKAGQKVMVLKSPKGIYMQLESGKIIAIRTSANNKPNNPTLPGQTFVPQQQQQQQQQQQPPPPPPPPQQKQQSTQFSTMAYNRPLPLDSSFNTGPKHDVAMQQIRNRSNLLRNNPSISITPKHIPTPSRSVQSPSYMPPTHSSAAGSQSSSPVISPPIYPPKLPSSITLTKFDRSPIPHKSSEIGIQADSANSCYGPRYPPEYPRSFDRYPVRNEYSPRLPQPFTNNYPPQYHRPSSSQ